MQKTHVLANTMADMNKVHRGRARLDQEEFSWLWKLFLEKVSSEVGVGNFETV